MTNRQSHLAVAALCLTVLALIVAGLATRQSAKTMEPGMWVYRTSETLVVQPPRTHHWSRRDRG